jgi:hypothetical protein
MKMFTKLALISSMAISANAMAMQSMDDAAMSATTGQDGINIGLGISKITIDRVLIHDNDGLAAGSLTVAGDPGFGGKAASGAIVIGGATADPTTPGITITTNAASLLDSHNLADIVIDTDAGTGNTSTGTGTAFLNVAAKVSGLNINIGEIGVSGSGTNVPATNIRRGNDAANYNKILSGLSLTTGKMTANIQLGAAPQGAMIKLNTTMAGGLTISNLGIFDASSKNNLVGFTAGTDTVLGTADDVPVLSNTNGEIRLDTIKLANAGGKDLSVVADISVVGESTGGANDGYLKINTMKTATDAYIAGIHLGSATAASIGDIEVQGLNVFNGAGGTTAGAIIKISGH